MNFIVRKETLLFLFISTIAALIVGNRGDTNDTQIYYDVFRYIDQLPLLNPVSFMRKLEWRSDSAGILGL